MGHSKKTKKIKQHLENERFLSPDITNEDAYSRLRINNDDKVGENKDNRLLK